MSGDIIATKGFVIEKMGKESLIYWNGQLEILSDAVGQNGLNRHFKGRHWHFVKVNGCIESTFFKRLNQKKSRVPFV